MSIPAPGWLKKWSGRCDDCARRARKKTDPIFHESGATILRSVRHPEDSDSTAYLCAECCPTFEQVEAWFAKRGVDIKTARDLTADELAAALKELGAECDVVHYVRSVDVDRRAHWGGRCDRCRDRARFNWVKLNDGGWARRDFESPTMGYVICPDCGAHRHISMPSGKNLERVTGRCPPCAGWRKRKLRDVVTHSSGAICLKSVRDPERTRDRAAFICASWVGKPDGARPPDCLRVDFGWFPQFDDDNWGGHCENCARRFENHPRTLTKDLPVYSWAQTQGPDGPFVELRAWIRYSNGGEKEVPIWFSACGEEQTLSRAYAQQLASLHNTQKGAFPKWCPSCAKDPDRIAAAIMAQAQNGNGQKNGSAKKSHRGPEKGSNAIVSEEKVREAFKILGSFAPQEKIAEHVGVDVRSLRRWHDDRGLSYRQLKQQLTETGRS